MLSQEATTGFQRWIPPPVHTLNYTSDCTAYAQYLYDTTDGGSAWGGWGTTYTVESAWLSASAKTLVDLLWAALPPESRPHYQNDDVWNTTSVEMMRWFLDNIKTITFDASLEDQARTCRSEICEALGFRGTGDVIGTGVLFAAVMECFMVFFYSLATATFIRRKRKMASGSISSSRPLLDRLLLAFRGSIGDFKRSAAVLALTMVTATCFVITKQKDPAPFEIPLAVLLSISSICAVLALSILETTWITGPHRRSIMSSAVCAALLVFTSGVVFAGVAFRRGARTLILLSTFTALFCLDEKQQRMIVKVSELMTVCFGFFPLLPLNLWLTSWAAGRLVTSHLVAGSKREFLVNRPLKLVAAIARLRKQTGVKILSIFVAFDMMCFAVAITIALKINLQFADDSYEWTFGQVLAVGTWIPICIEWWYIFLFGMKEGLEGRIPYEYEVNHVQDFPEGCHHGTKARRYSC
ncbi:hypothetical protein V8F06_001646 [Rhypophila decipiens]